MKKLLFSVVMLAMVAVSCDKIDESGETLVKEPMTIGISTNGLDLSYSPLSMSRATSGTDLLAVQVYDGETPVANGLVEEWSALTFEGYSNTEYRVVATMIVDATSVISESGSVYALPFNSEITSNLVTSSEALSALASSTATLAADNAEYSIPNIDRYYGTATKTVTTSDSSITTYMKRMSFGVKYDGVSSIDLKIAGAPVVTLSNGDTELFSLGNFSAAYVADETTEAYSETIATTFGESATIYNIDYKRNQQVTISNSTGNIGFEFETGFENITGLRVLTFEDTDYNAGANYIGLYSWSSLIDSYYYGPLLYSDATQYTWTDTNNTFLNSVVNEGYGWYDPWPIVYYFSAGGIVVSNHYTAVVTGTEVTYDDELSVPNGSAGAAGNNGSANFAVVMDGSASGMGSAPYLTFGDGTVRTIDHLYISATSYLASVALDGNGFSDPLGAEDTFTITATGYDADDIETGSTSYELAVSGALVDGWNRWDLNSLGKVVKVKFSITSSVEATWGGMSLPTYFAIDDIAVIFE